MAFAWRDPPVATIEFRDDDGNTSRVSFGVNGDLAAGPDHTTLRGFVERVATRMAAISDASVSGLSLTFSGYDDAFPAAEATSEVERKGLFIVRDADAYLGSVEVPSIDQDVLSPDRISIDLENAAVADLLEYITDPIDMTPFSLLGNVSMNNTKGVDFVTVEEAYQVHRQSHKQRSRRG